MDEGSAGSRLVRKWGGPLLLRWRGSMGGLWRHRNRTAQVSSGDLGTADTAERSKADRSNLAELFGLPIRPHLSIMPGFYIWFGGRERPATIRRRR